MPALDDSEIGEWSERGRDRSVNWVTLIGIASAVLIVMITLKCYGTI